MTPGSKGFVLFKSIESMTTQYTTCIFEAILSISIQNPVTCGSQVVL